MKKLLQLTIILIFAAGLTSCVSNIQTRYYLIDTEPTVERAKKHYPLILEVSNVGAPSRYQNRMFYRASDYEVGFYEYSQWVETPAEMVRVELINMLWASGLFDQVFPAGVIAAPDITLQCEVAGFDQVITSDGYFADCELKLEVTKREGGKPIWTYESKSRVAQEGKEQFVAAMNKAVYKAISDSIKNMEKSDALQEMADKEKAGN